AAARVVRVVHAGALVLPTLVDLTVAVVVDAVAGLGAGRARSDRALGAVAGAIADDVALPRARADTNRAGPAERKSVVDDAVAIVVERVAQLGDRHARGDRALHAAAVRGAHVAALARACADANGAALAERREPVVDDTVAVVIATVAELRRRRACSCRALDA